MSDYMVEETTGRATARYGHAAATFHWLSAALVLLQLYLGFTFADLPRGPERMEIFTWHKTVGVAILLVAVLRLIQRRLNPPPPYPADMPVWDRRIAVWSHRVFYTLLFVIPLTGLIAVSKPGRSTVELAGGLSVPALPLGEGIGETHEPLVFLFIALLILHVAGAVWHQWIRGDAASGRMPPFRRAER